MKKNQPFPQLNKLLDSLPISSNNQTIETKKQLTQQLSKNVSTTTNSKDANKGGIYTYSLSNF